MAEQGPDSGRAGPRRRALVTGASSGIGAAFAQRLARDQYDLTLVARRGERLAEIAKELRETRGVEVELLSADLVDAEGLARVTRSIEASVPDLLVNNAGIGSFGRFVDLDPDSEIAEIELNVLALVRLTRAALPGMIDRGRGAVINVSSLAGLHPMPLNATYGASKAFVGSFTEALHEELRDTGVKMQLLCPGFTRTAFQETAGVDPSRVPDFVWMEADQVAEASLDSLARGELLCVPGAANRWLSRLQRAAPNALTRRLAHRLGSQALED